MQNIIWVREEIGHVRKAAKRGNAQAQFELSLRFLVGRGGVEQDIDSCITWANDAADRGYGPAQVFVGRCFADGMGVPCDSEAAYWWFRKAALSGNAAGQFSLACCYWSGLGCSLNQKAALEWCVRAAGQGHPKALRTLAVFASSPNGGQKNELARALLKLAAQRGDVLAKEMLACASCAAPESRNTANAGRRGVVNSCLSGMGTRAA